MQTLQCKQKMDHLLHSIGLGVLAFHLSRILSEVKGTSDRTSTSCDGETTSVPVYQEVVIGARRREPFLVFNFNTVLLLITVGILLVIFETLCRYEQILTTEEEYV